MFLINGTRPGKGIKKSICKKQRREASGLHLCSHLNKKQCKCYREISKVCCACGYIKNAVKGKFVFWVSYFFLPRSPRRGCVSSGCVPVQFGYLGFHIQNNLFDLSLQLNCGCHFSPNTLEIIYLLAVWS